MKYIKTVTLLLLVISLTDVTIAASRDAGDGGDDPTYKIKLMLRQVMAEKDAVNAKNAKLDAEINKLKQDIAAKDKKLSATNGKLKKSGERGQQLTERLQESYATLRKVREENNELKSNLQVVTVHKQNAEADLGQCMKMNVKLFGAGMEVLSRYEKEVTESAEPIFRINAVELETAIQDYRFKMEDLAIPEYKVQQMLNKNQPDQEKVSATATE